MCKERLTSISQCWIYSTGEFVCVHVCGVHIRLGFLMSLSTRQPSGHLAFSDLTFTVALLCTSHLLQGVGTSISAERCCRRIRFQLRFHHSSPGGSAHTQTHTHTPISFTKPVLHTFPQLQNTKETLEQRGSLTPYLCTAANDLPQSVCTNRSKIHTPGTFK